MEFIVFLIITVINFILGVTILLKGIKNKVNISFFFVILSIIFWAISNYLGDYFAESVKNEFFSTLFTRLAYTAATLIAVLFLYFVLIFPREKIKTSKIKYFIIFLIAITVGIFTQTKLIISHVDIVDLKVNVITGQIYPIFTAYFLLFMGLAFIVLIKKYRKSSGIEKMQIQYLFLGTFLTTLFAAITNLIIPVLTKNFYFSRYGTSFTVILVAFTAYAIIKHRLMDIVVIIRKVTILGILLMIILGIFSMVAFGLPFVFADSL